MASFTENKYFGINKLIFLLISVPYLLFILPMTFVNMLVFWTPLYVARKFIERCCQVVWKEIKYKNISVIANFTGSAVCFLILILEVYGKMPYSYKTVTMGVRNHMFEKKI